MGNRMEDDEHLLAIDDAGWAIEGLDLPMETVFRPVWDAQAQEIVAYMVVARGETPSGAKSYGYSALGQHRTLERIARLDIAMLRHAVQAAEYEIPGERPTYVMSPVYVRSMRFDNIQVLYHDVFRTIGRAAKARIILQLIVDDPLFRISDVRWDTSKLSNYCDFVALHLGAGVNDMQILERVPVGAVGCTAYDFLPAAPALDAHQRFVVRYAATHRLSPFATGVRDIESALMLGGLGMRWLAGPFLGIDRTDPGPRRRLTGEDLVRAEREGRAPTAR